MKVKIKCPKCQFENPQPLTDQKDRYYCPKCKHVWIIGKEDQSLKEKGSLDFKGVMPAKELVEMMSKNLKLTPEMKSALVAQFSGSLFEQWYEGFKTGLLADIVHKRDIYDHGKTRNESGDANRKHPERDRQDRKQDHQDSSRVEPTIEPRKEFNRVKEKVTGVDFIRPKQLTLTDEQYAEAAGIIARYQIGQVKEVYFDGTHYTVKLKP